ncbi:ABC transporter substrate-binding protein [Nesterenkonia flava]|uniref:ABC transporter substrate-binding protein n=1 Tax=Nesterenkonia flava TaxID=469799 RepID=A0ABU1FU27_9MICC|nr:ABC transporter substrate-binding protein [Nesterenkonia flava]MDR5712118.1 ABC transporter substrate-binding protein [Nesterenkonia flava]
MGAAASVLLVACSQEQKENTSIEVVDTAGMPSAFLQYGVDRGHFDDVGAEVSVEPSSSGAAAIPVLISGDVQFAGSDAVSGLVAADRGLPVLIAAGGTRTSDEAEEDFARVFVRAGNDEFHSIEDLGGATFAVNSLENVNDFALMTVLEKHGVDTSALKFIELGFPEMAPALEAGDVDAALMIEPFVTMALEQGFDPVLSPYVESRPELMIGLYLTSEEFAEEHPDIVEAFRDGVAATAADIAEDPDAFREALPGLSEIESGLAQQVRLPQWSGEADRESLAFTSDQMLRFGMLDEPSELDHLLILD